MERRPSKYQRLNIPGHAHELTFSCYKNQLLLEIDKARESLSIAIEKASQKHSFSLWAYVFMPDHIHLLIHPEKEEYSISQILKSIKQPVAISVIAFLKRINAPVLDFLRTGLKKPTFRFWQDGGGYDRNYWDSIEIRKHIEYIHNNPVRKGLAETVTDWEWSSARDWLLDEMGPVKINKEGFPFL